MWVTPMKNFNFLPSFLKKLPDNSKSRCSDLVRASKVLDILDIRNPIFLGRQQVPLERIVGSFGRYTDFDLDFKLRQRMNRERWDRVAAARRAGLKLPAIDLIKVGDIYLVQDGNHRISVARSRGEDRIAALVTEIENDSLPRDENCQRLGFRLKKNGCPGQP
jgi:hypothetical protein